MKITLDIPDALLHEARVAARADGITLHTLVEHGLHLALKEQRKLEAFRLRDASVDGNGLQPGVEGLSWDQIRSLVYGDREDGPH
jgi:hypothetical protein